MKDIYYKMNNLLLSDDFWNLAFDEKKNLIEKSYKSYLISKIYEYNINILSSVNVDILSVESLIEILGNLIPKEEHFNTLNHVIHCILNIIGNLQGWSVLWCQEDKETLIECPIIEFDINGKWNKLSTHEKTDYVKIFKFVYYIFKNEFKLENNIAKKLEYKSINMELNY